MASTQYCAGLHEGALCSHTSYYPTLLLPVPGSAGAGKLGMASSPGSSFSGSLYLLPCSRSSGQELVRPHFPEQEMEAQKGIVTGLRSHRGSSPGPLSLEGLCLGSRLPQVSVAAENTEWVDGEPL